MVDRLAGIALAIWFTFGGAPAHAGVDRMAGGCEVVLVPGAFGGGYTSWFLSFDDYFSEYSTFFRGMGCDVRKITLPDITIEERARILKGALEHLPRTQSRARALYLVAHSQGGLDARYALKSLKLQGVKALLTVGTPHRGTPLADWVVRERDEGTVFYWFLRWIVRYDLRVLSFANQMTAQFLARHPDWFADVPEVDYASARVSCRTDCHWALRGLAWWTGTRWAGDGIVPAENQAFGEDLGEFDLDHISSVGIDSVKHGERRKLLGAMWDFLAHRAK